VRVAAPTQHVAPAGVLLLALWRSCAGHCMKGTWARPRQLFCPGGSLRRSSGRDVVPAQLLHAQPADQVHWMQARSGAWPPTHASAAAC